MMSATEANTGHIGFRVAPQEIIYTVGAGIGASPVGAGVGFAAGAVAGTLAWLAIPEFKIGDAAAVSLVGLAAGGLAGWVAGTGGDGKDPPLLLPLQIRF